MPDASSVVTGGFVQGVGETAPERTARAIRLDGLAALAAQTERQGTKSIVDRSPNNGWRTDTAKMKAAATVKVSLKRTVGPPSAEGVPSSDKLKRLANSAFRRADAQKRDFIDALEAMLATIRLLDQTALSDFMWRAQQAPGRDGFKSGPAGERVDGSGGDTSLTSVESAVESRCFGKVEMVDGSPVPSPPQPLRDPAGLALANLQAALYAGYECVAIIDRSREYLQSIHASAPKDRELTTEVCAGCDQQILGKLHRVDGEAFHDGADPPLHGDCYQARKRLKQRERANS